VPDARVSRRALLAVPVLAAAGLTACRRGSRPFRAEDFTMPARSDVALLSAAAYDDDLVDLVSRGLGLLDVDVRGRRVLLKPNMVEYERASAINTDPRLVGAAGESFLQAGAREVIVAEGPGHRRDIEYLVSSTGLADHLRDLRLRFADLNGDDVRVTPLRSWFTGLREMALPAEILDADIVVSMPKLKTHHWAGMTCSMKNLFGVVPGAVYGWPKNLLHYRGIPNAIVDLTATVRPALSIVDGIVAMEGDGPIMGTPRHLGLVAMGRDPVAVDATCARVIGIEPIRLPYLAWASQFLGRVEEKDIPQRAEPLTRFRTRFEPGNALISGF
jgi:uncharacterized protein (DUF362 family)